MSVDAFLKELGELRMRAGNPSLGVLSRRTGIPRSTLFDALNPKRVTLPPWQTVSALVAALGASPPERERVAEAWREAALPRPGRLPPAPSGFTGREAELAKLDHAIGAVSVISGAGGMGKTWLALRWAQQRAESFPDGGLYLDLRGFDPTAEPTDPAAALGSLLRALGVPPQAIPPHPDAQAGLYRTILAGKRMLVLLDNARDTAQVAPLLPGGPHTTVLITSRHRLPGLVATHGAVPVTLGPLTEAEAHSLLAQRIGPQRLTAEPEAARALLKMCDGLPLALGLVATAARNKPLARLAAPITGAIDHHRPDHARPPAARHAGESENPQLHTGIRGVLDSSLRALTGPARSLFGLLALMPGPDIGLAGAGALAGTPIRAQLRELDNAHLVEEYAPGRFRLHDLVRQHAVRDLEPDLPALRRLLDYYLDAARANNRILEPFATEAQGRTVAKAWFDTEWACLLAAVAAARRQGWDRLALELSEALHLREFHQPGAADIDRGAVELARGLHDRAALGRALRNLGRTLMLHIEFDPAFACLDEALAVFEKAGDTLERAVTEHTLAWAWDRRRDAVAAMEHGARSLSLLEGLDHPLWTARVLNAVGWYHSNLREFDAAESCCRQALELCRRHGFAELESYVWHSIGVNHLNAGRHRQALTYLNACLERGRLVDSWLIEPTCLLFVGNAHLALGERRAARQAWMRARQILRSQHRLEEVGQADAKLRLLSHQAAR